MGFLRLLEGIRLPAFSAFFSVVTYFGDEIAFMLAAFILFWCVDKRTGYYAFLAGLFGTIANQFLKIACRIPRPWVLDPDFTIVESGVFSEQIFYRQKSRIETAKTICIFADNVVYSWIE